MVLVWFDPCLLRVVHIVIMLFPGRALPPLLHPLSLGSPSPRCRGNMAALYCMLGRGSKPRVLHRKARCQLSHVRPLAQRRDRPKHCAYISSLTWERAEGEVGFDSDVSRHIFDGYWLLLYRDFSTMHMIQFWWEMKQRKRKHFDKPHAFTVRSVNPKPAVLHIFSLQPYNSRCSEYPRLHFVSHHTCALCIMRVI